MISPLVPVNGPVAIPVHAVGHPAHTEGKKERESQIHAHTHIIGLTSKHKHSHTSEGFWMLAPLRLSLLGYSVIAESRPRRCVLQTRDTTVQFHDTRVTDVPYMAAYRMYNNMPNRSCRDSSN